MNGDDAEGINDCAYDDVVDQCGIDAQKDDPAERDYCQSGQKSDQEQDCFSGHEKQFE